MSISLISRHLNALKLAQRAVVEAPLFSARAPAANGLPQLAPRRTFSGVAPAAEDDDGGPVAFKGMSNRELADMSTVPGWNLVHNPPRRNPRGALVGTVVSDKMQKTVNVAVDRFKMIPKYRKRWRFTRKFMAHDEHEVCNVGDLVMIVPCQRISRHKHFMVREIIRAKGQL